MTHTHIRIFNINRYFHARWISKAPVQTVRACLSLNFHSLPMAIEQPLQRTALDVTSLTCQQIPDAAASAHRPTGQSYDDDDGHFDQTSWITRSTRTGDRNRGNEKFLNLTRRVPRRPGTQFSGVTGLHTDSPDGNVSTGNSAVARAFDNCRKWSYWMYSNWRILRDAFLGFA